MSLVLFPFNLPRFNNFVLATKIRVKLIELITIPLISSYQGYLFIKLPLAFGLIIRFILVLSYHCLICYPISSYSLAYLIHLDFI